jgi:NADPH2:quinone reductase
VRVRPGMTVLVYAAAGGVGTATIQIARSLGATVYGAVGSPEKLDLVRSLGAEAFTYDEIPEDLAVDVVFDPVGGQLFADSFARLRPLGSVIAIGSAGGAWPQVDPARIVGRNVGLHGFFLGRMMRLDPELIGTGVGELLGLWETGAFKPVVGAELPLEEVDRAHELVESRQSVGKVVLLP